LLFEKNMSRQQLLLLRHVLQVFLLFPEKAYVLGIPKPLQQY